MKTIYNTFPEEKKEDCNNFELDVKLEKEPKGKVFWAQKKDCSAFYLKKHQHCFPEKTALDTNPSKIVIVVLFFDNFQDNFTFVFNCALSFLVFYSYF